MDDLDFSSQPSPAARPAAPPRPADDAKAAAEVSSYDPKLALRFFQIAGETETFAAGTRIFAEQDKPGGFFSRGARVYLLLQGQVALTLQGKPLSLVLPGETFGELAVISDAPRSATATAFKDCTVLSLDEKRFLASLREVPEFALMLVSSMAQQLRRSVDRLLAAKPGPVVPRDGGRGLDHDMLGDLRRAMGNPTPRSMRAGDAIVTKGAVGVCMYVVTEGRIAIGFNGAVIERVGPGEIFGETALLGPTARAASAVAETSGAWLPVSREEFLGLVKSQPAAGIALLRSMSERIQHINALLGGWKASS